MTLKFRRFLSLLLALTVCCTVLAAAAYRPGSTVEAADRAIPLSATRYRYPIMRYENAKFLKGVPIDDNPTTRPFLNTDTKGVNGKTENHLVYARVDEYDMFNMKVGKNKALYIQNQEIVSPIVAENYMSYCHRFGAEVDTREHIFPDSIQGVPTNSTDHGVMFHVEVKGNPERPDDGFSHAKRDDKGNPTGEYTKHVIKDVGIVFQEWDYKPDGTPKKKKGKVVCTAMNIKPGAKITLIWTKQIDWVNPDPTIWENMDYIREENGKGVVESKDANGKVTYKTAPMPDRHHKPGDVEVITTPSFTLDGKKVSGGHMDFPRDFCGYVIIPFSEFQLCWDGADYDGMLNFKKMELCDLISGSYWYHRGTVIYDEYCFWGPTFSKVDGAYDYGNISFENHKDSLINRKRITIKEEKPSEPPSVEAPSEIQKDVTLKNKETGILIEAPSSAKLDTKAPFHVTVIKPDENEYSRLLYERLFGKDQSKFRAYNLFLGEDGDIEPADFVQISFPIPEGMDAAACKVYTLGTDTVVEKIPIEHTLSADQKTLSIKVRNLGTYILATDGAAGEEAVSQQSDAPTVEEPSAEEKPAVSNPAAQEQEEQKANLTWLWITLGVVAALGIGAAVFFVLRAKKKNGPTDDPQQPTE